MAAALVQVPPPPPSLLHMPATSPTTAMNNNSNPPISSKQKSDTNTWEFTRRKRWPELLINELSEAIAFILSPTGKVLFCSPAVQELLGWRDEELIDADLADLVNGTQS
jgi:PAS domain-containing protein